MFCIIRFLFGLYDYYFKETRAGGGQDDSEVRRSLLPLRRPPHLSTGPEPLLARNPSGSSVFTVRIAWGCSGGVLVPRSPVF